MAKEFLPTDFSLIYESIDLAREKVLNIWVECLRSLDFETLLEVTECFDVLDLSLAFSSKISLGCSAKNCL